MQLCSSSAGTEYRNRIKCPVPCVLLFRMKYIETELKKRKGIVENEEQKVKLKNAEDSLYELPENIRVSSAKKTEEMLSNQMLSGIPEVDLGIEYVFHRSVGDGQDCQDEQLFVGRAALWLDYTASVWAGGGLSSIP